MQPPKSEAAHAPIDIRDLTIDDLAPIYHLGEDLFTSDRYPFLYRTWDEWEVIGLYNTDADYCLVAEADGGLAGFILGTVIIKGSWTYGYIIWLGVDPRFQKRGVADRLVDKLIERMIEEGVRYMLVDTDPRNDPAIRFFRRKGFGKTREHVYLSMNLSRHERYGRLIEREKEREIAEKVGRKLARTLRGSRQRKEIPTGAGEQGSPPFDIDDRPFSVDQVRAGQAPATEGIGQDSIPLQTRGQSRKRRATIPRPDPEVS